MLKNAETYEIMTPESVGVSKTSLVMGKHSGRHAFKEKLRDLGYDLGDNAVQDAFKRFKDLADRKKHVYDEDLVALIDDELGNAHERIVLEALTVIAGTAGQQTATLTLAIDGAHRTHQARGNGPVDAIFNAIRALEPHEAELELFQIHAVTEGTDAQAEVTVRLGVDGRAFTARGADPDTLVACARAYLGSLNKLQAWRRPGQCAKRHGPGLTGRRARRRRSPRGLAPPGAVPERALQPMRRLLHAAPRPGTPIGCDGRLAQLVEQLTLNQRVVGSRPTAPTITINDLAHNSATFASQKL